MAKKLTLVFIAILGIYPLTTLALWCPSCCCGKVGDAVTVNNVRIGQISGMQKLSDIQTKVVVALDKKAGANAAGTKTTDIETSLNKIAQNAGKNSSVKCAQQNGAEKVVCMVTITK